MPHTFLHITSVRLLEGEDNLHPLAREALKRRRDLATLGAVLTDLPQYEQASRNVLSRLSARSSAQSVWSERLHHERPMAVGVELVRPRADAPGPLARLALGLGYFAHAALDVVLHPATHRLVQAEGGGDGDDLSAVHRRIEAHQAVLLHPRVSGFAIDDDSLVWQACELVRLAGIEPAVRHVDDSVRAARGAESPTENDWRMWLAGLQRYGKRLHGRFARAAGAGVSDEEARTRYFDAVDFASLFLEAQARAVVFANRLAAFFEERDLSESDVAALREAFPECRLDNTEAVAGPLDMGVEIAMQKESARLWQAHDAQRRETRSSAMRKPDGTSLFPGESTPPPVLPQVHVFAAREDASGLPEVPLTPGMIEEMSFIAPRASNPDGTAEADGAGDGSDDNPLRPRGRSPR